MAYSQGKTKTMPSILAMLVDMSPLLGTEYLPWGSLGIRSCHQSHFHPVSPRLIRIHSSSTFGSSIQSTPTCGQSPSVTRPRAGRVGRLGP
jgi:hypothetical protein